MKIQPIWTRDAESATFRRTMKLDRTQIDVEARTVPATLASSSPVRRWFGEEVLSMAPGAVDISRSEDGLPLLWSHDQRDPIGIVERVAVDGDRITGLLRFSKNPTAERIFAEVRDGFLKHVSIGYNVLRWADTATGRRADSWELVEGSVVAVPADPAAAIARDGESAVAMTRDVVDLDAARQRGAELERARTTEILRIFDRYPGHTDLLRACLDEPGCTADVAARRLLDRIGADTEPLGGGARGATGGEDERDKFFRAAADSLAVRCDFAPQINATDSPAIRAEKEESQRALRALRRSAGENPFTGLTLAELAGEYLRVAGIDTRGMSRDRRVAAALSHRAAGIISHSPADFTSLLAATVNKALGIGYEEAPETWAQWVRIGQLPDFKAGSRPVMSTFSDLDDITGDKEYKYGSFSDRSEPIQLKTFGKLFSISRTAIVNDDLSAFSEIPRHMGRAASRMVGDEVYGKLTANAALSDAIALFHASHNNLTASGGAPSVAQFNAAYTLFAKQTDPAGNVLNLQPSHLIVPAALRPASRALIAGDRDPTVASGEAVNIYQNELNLVSDARLDADSAVVWYLAAASSSVGTVEVAFLDGVQSPFLDSEDGFTRDGVTYKVRLDFGAAVLDHRGLYKNAGQ